MKLNTSFVKNMRTIYGQEGKVWLSNLSVHLEKLSAQWNFQIIHPIKNISYHFVVVVYFINSKYFWIL